MEKEKEEDNKEGGEHNKEDRAPALPASIGGLLRTDATRFTYLELAANFTKCRLISMQGLDVFTRLRNVDLSYNSLGIHFISFLSFRFSLLYNFIYLLLLY